MPVPADSGEVAVCSGARSCGYDRQGGMRSTFKVGRRWSGAWIMAALRISRWWRQPEEGQLAGDGGQGSVVFFQSTADSSDIAVCRLCRLLVLLIEQLGPGACLFSWTSSALFCFLGDNSYSRVLRCGGYPHHSGFEHHRILLSLLIGGLR